MKTVKYNVSDMRMVPEGLWVPDYVKSIIYKGFYGEAKSVEADLCIHRENMKIGLDLNHSHMGGYTCLLMRKDGRQLLVLLRRSAQNFCEAFVYLDTLGIELALNQMFHLKVSIDREAVTVELDGRPVLHHEHDPKNDIYSIGECGYQIYPTRDAGRVENFSIQGEALPKPEPKPVILPEPYLYEMDLGQVTEGELPEEWTKKPGTDGLFVHEKNLVAEKVPYAESLIYQFDNNPKIKAQLSVKGLDEYSKFGFILRKAPRTAYLKVGYDAGVCAWFLQDVPALCDCEIRTFNGVSCTVEENRTYSVEILAEGSRVEVKMDGEQVLCVDDVRQCGYGKTGIFAEFAEMTVSALSAVFSSGVAPTKGAISHCADETKYQGSMEVELLGDGELIGVSKQALYRSLDGGESFGRAPEEYSGVDVKGYYQSITKLRSGKFLQVLLHKGSEIQISEDLKTWTTVGRVLPDEWVELAVAQKFMTHVGTFTELKRPDGGYRLFLPMYVNTYRKDEFPVHPKGGHDTICFYSDDEGRTWQHSDWISPEFEAYNGTEPIDWAESKIIKCSDGSLRMYCSRNNSHYFSYLESFDFGQSWHNIGVIPQMQCARSSFGIAEDPDREGTWYVAWVNDTPRVRGEIFSRTRLSLARTRDGKNWEFLGDVERFSERFADGVAIGAPPLFQIIDPSVSADDRYIYVTWGGSMWATKRDPGTKRVMNDPSTIAVHNELRPMFARIEKDKLQAQPWSAATVSDMSRLACDLTKEKW